MSTAEAFKLRSTDSRWGRTTTAARRIPPTSARVIRTSGRRANAGARGRTSSADCQLDASARSVRPLGRRPANSATTMMTPRIGSSNSGFDEMKVTPACRVPRASAIGAVGAGPYGDTGRGRPEEQGEGGDGDGDDDRGDQVVGVEDRAPDGHAAAEGLVQPVGEQAL